MSGSLIQPRICYLPYGMLNLNLHMDSNNISAESSLAEFRPAKDL